ncbi:MAG: hypothetical protein RIT28_1263 [Pseudomonadota bacterium]|jgi:hypothetical protein
MDNQTPRYALTFTQRAMAHPYQTLLIAAGVGYVLGGGLFTRFTMSMLRAGVRMGALPLVRRALFDAAEVALSLPAQNHNTQNTQSPPDHQPIH